MSQIELRGCANHKSTLVHVCEPWNFVPSEIPETALQDKMSWVQWCSDESTNHLFYTTVEALNPAIRAGKNNPMCKLHGFIADYDAKISDHNIETIRERCPAEFIPTWIHRTRFSGGVRVLWLFEEPLLLDLPQLADKFFRVAAVNLRLKKLFAGLDEGAWTNAFTTFEVGKDWKAIGGKPIPKNVLHYWMSEAATKVEWKFSDQPSIPIEEIAKQVEEKFPGRWPGEFEDGQRGPVFFEPTSKNPTAAIVTPGGMVCFSTDKLFYSWAEIFGRAFVDRFQADKVGAAVADVWYDGRHYYRKVRNSWMGHTKEDFVAHLKVRRGLDGVKDKGATASEVDHALVTVHETRRVVGLLPRVFDPEETIHINGNVFLNCACVKTITPADECAEWGEGFPWIAQFLDTCFDPPEQKGYLLAWWKRLYESAHQHDLKKGLALFLAGGVGRGKTLLSDMIGMSVGGSADAGDYLLSETNFNKELLEVGVWNIDDGVAAQDPQGHLKFSEMVKRSVANPHFSYHPKYKDPQRVTWNGRIIVTLNNDSTSLRMLPNLDASIEDKLLILNFSDAERVFPDWNALATIKAVELPHLMRWLLDWKPEPHLLSHDRFGTAKYIHEGLRQQATAVGGVADLLELIESWAKRANPPNPWEGTATDWMATVMGNDELRPLASKYTPRLIGRKFTEAARIRGSKIEVISGTHKGNGNRYRIDVTPSPDLPPNQTIDVNFVEPHAVSGLN